MRFKTDNGAPRLKTRPMGLLTTRRGPRAARWSENHVHQIRRYMFQEQRERSALAAGRSIEIFHRANCGVGQCTPPVGDAYVLRPGGCRHHRAAAVQGMCALNGLTTSRG